MKYMGSKRCMLGNGLGETLTLEIPKAKRFIDLFTGSGAVAWYAARGWAKPVVAGDLQHFAVALAAAVIEREQPVRKDSIFYSWIRRARSSVETHETYKMSVRLQEEIKSPVHNLLNIVEESRNLCGNSSSGPVQQAYGGYYFSPLQSLWIDSLRASLPRSKKSRSVALAALIASASRCAAAPGHTAQPFKPNASAGPFLREAWLRDVCTTVSMCFEAIGKNHAQTSGAATKSDAELLSTSLGEGDLAFIDPPYSSVHYSRFYHVLETISEGQRVVVFGTGRYPPECDRPKSDFSIKSRAWSAFERLLSALSKNGVRAIITFPAEECSNGLRGQDVIALADEHFEIASTTITSRFSTLGGNKVIRAARNPSQELILTLYPR